MEPRELATTRPAPYRSSLTMRIFVRILAVALLLTAVFAFAGPYAPEGSFLHDWASAFREALNAWWGFPLGVPG
jgi:hypothetical protein